MDVTEYQARQFPPKHVHAMPVFRALTRPIIRTPEQGADTII